jgi:hypothetical protein
MRASGSLKAPPAGTSKEEWAQAETLAVRSASATSARRRLNSSSGDMRGDFLAAVKVGLL